MDLDTINTVITVARLKSFSATALSVPCSQSSVSRRVEAAENELGVKIFERASFGGNKGLSLTPAGEEIVRSMVKVVDAYTDLYRVAAEASGETKEVINLGIVANMMPPQGFARMKSDFFDRCPDITLSVKTDSLSDLISQFRTRSVDAVLFTCANLIKEDFELEESEDLCFMGSTKLFVGVSENSPLAKKESVQLADLKNETFLLNTEDPKVVPGITIPSRISLNNRFKSAGFKPRFTSIPQDMLEIRYVKAKQGIGIFPSHTPKDWRVVEGISYVAVEGFNGPVYYYLLRATGRKEKAIDAFADFFRDHME